MPAGLYFDPTAIQRTAARSSSEKAKIQVAAQQFEALLLHELVKHAVPKGDDMSDSMASKTYGDMLAHQLAGAMASSGSIGLAQMLAGDIKGAPAPMDTHHHQGEVHGAKISSAYGNRVHPVTGRHHHHSGVDVALSVGTPLHAPDGGRVSRISESKNGGLSVTLSHSGGRTTTFRHLDAALVQEGQVVSEGQVIAQSGASGRVTGPHLHLESRVRGNLADPTALVESVIHGKRGAR